MRFQLCGWRSTGRRECANSGHSAAARRTGKFDPVQERAYERARSARKRTSAEGV